MSVVSSPVSPVDVSVPPPCGGVTGVPLSTATPTQSNYVPSQMERHLQCLRFKECGELVLGASSLSSRYWVGSLWYYKNPGFAPAVNKCLTGVDIENGLSHIAFVGKEQKQILVGLDNGSVDCYSLSFSEEEDAASSFHYLERTANVHEHDDLITGLEVTADGTKIVTASHDRSIVVLSSETFGKLCRFSVAHRDLIVGLDVCGVKGTNNDCVITASQDGRTALWDIRENGKDQKGRVFNVSSASPTCVRWIHDDEHCFLVGDNRGQVSIFDTRQGKESLVTQQACQQQLHKIQVSPKRPNLFATCSDSNSVQVFELDKGFSIFNKKYCDSLHSDFIRDVVWHPQTDELWTCGWDTQVLSRKVM